MNKYNSVIKYVWMCVHKSLSCKEKKIKIFLIYSFGEGATVKF